MSNHPVRKITYAIQKLSILFQTKNYKEGIQFADETNKQILTQRNNWILLNRFDFCCSINYDLNRAFYICNKVIKSEYINLGTNSAISQLWLIHKAYLQFMLNYTGHPEAKKFNLYKFINEVGIYSKDKSGYNFSIIVIELMFYLLHNDLDKYIDKMTALMSYRIRHLKVKSFKRSSVFAQLLFDLEKQSFDLKKIEKISQKKYNYLVSLEDRLNINEWEIIGYDKLWNIVLDLLSNRN